MTLDPNVKDLLNRMARAGVVSVEEQTPKQARDQMILGSAMMGKPEDVEEVADRKIPGPDGHQIPIRIYWPTGERPLPAVVYFHGGGWVVGSIATHDGYCRAVANAANVIVVSVDYRLAPEHKYPAAVEDAYAATAWVAKHAGEIGADAEKIAVAGDSAGGNLAAAVALMARDRDGPTLAYQVLIYPITDYNFETESYLENAAGYYLTRSGMQWFWEHYLAEESDGHEPYAAPLRAESLSGLPPALVITAEYDPLRDEGEAYAQRLRDAGVRVTATRYEGLIHGFVRRFELLPQAHDALAQVAAALQKGFGTGSTS